MDPSERDSASDCEALSDSHCVAVLSELEAVTNRHHDGQTLIKQLLGDMRRHWAAGRRPVAEQYLAALPAETDTELIVDLIYGEFLLRQECGEPASTSFMIERFPQYRTQLERQFEFDELLMPTQASDREDLQPTVPPRSGARHPLFVEKNFPQTLGKYVLIAPLDSGGQAEVYLALHTALRKDVVIKLGKYALETLAPDRLLEEARILVRLEHPSLARVYDLDVHEGHPYVVLEYVRGTALARFHRQTPLAPRDAAILVAKIARAVAYSHREQVLHLDIKPQNVLVDPQGEPRLIDFGLAQLSGAWTPEMTSLGFSGTLQYMAPEQTAPGQKDVGPAADIYALGGVLYFLLTNQSPHADRTVSDLQRGKVDHSWNRELLADKSIPAQLREICTRALATEQRERYTSADEMAKDLEQFAKPIDRRGFLAAMALCGLAVLGSLGWLAMSAKLPPLGKPSLVVEAWDSDSFLSLEERLPLIPGDEIRFRGTLPPHCHAALLHLSSEGKWDVLQRWQVKSHAENFFYPAVGQALPLQGQAGTEFVVLCVSQQPLTLEAVEKSWAPGKALPPVNAESLVHVDNEHGVQTENHSKAIGPPISHEDTEGAAIEQLAKLGLKLDAQGVQFYGLGFFHK